jgi:glutathione S-transferase
MIKLYAGGPAFGLPDASPFALKTQILMHLAGVDFALVPYDFKKAPKGKIPYIQDGDSFLGDSTFIRFHLEKKYNFDFEAGLTAKRRATMWAMEKLSDEVLYWALVYERWMIDSNFDKGPRHFFDSVPAIIRPLVVGQIRKSVKTNLNGQGTGRHSYEEILILADKALEAVSIDLGDQKFFGGEDLCGGDATLGAMMIGLLCAHFEGPLRNLVLKYPNLVAYEARIRERFDWRS